YPLSGGVIPARVLGAEFVTAAPVFQSLSELSLQLEYVAEVAVSLGVILIDSDSLAVLRDGVIQPTLSLQGVAEVVVGLGEALLESDSVAVLGDGLVETALVF